MTEEELKTWFWNRFNSCYAVKHDDFDNRIYLFYDEQFIRKSKLCKLNNQEIKSPTRVSGICLFEYDMKNKWFNCSNDEIWQFFEKNYSNNYIAVQKLIRSWFKEYDNLNDLNVYIVLIPKNNIFKDKKKLSVYTPNNYLSTHSSSFKYNNKLTIL